MQPIDFSLAAGILAISILQAFADPEKLKGMPRTTFFTAGALTGLGLGAAVLLAWHSTERPIGGFGLYGWAGERPGLSVILAAAWLLLLLAGLRLCLGRYRREARDYYSDYEHLMPRTRREVPLAYGAGTLAGAGEEIAFRGFLFWFLQPLAGLAGALFLSSIVFGIAHGYQGKRGMAFAAIAGLVLGSAYLVSESLPLVIWMHATYNIVSFTLGHLLLSGRDAAPAPAPAD